MCSVIEGIYLGTNINRQHEPGTNSPEGRHRIVKLKPGPCAVPKYRDVAGPVACRPIIHRLDVRGEISDKAHANGLEQEQSRD